MATPAKPVTYTYPTSQSPRLFVENTPSLYSSCGSMPHNLLPVSLFWASSPFSESFVLRR